MLWPTYKGWYESGPLRLDTPIHRRIVDFALVSGRWITRFVALWALAAGGWRAAEGNTRAITSFFKSDDFHVVWFAFNVLGQASGAFVAILLVGAAALLFGGALGFLFGLPRSSPLPATMAGNSAEPPPDGSPAGRTMRNAASDEGRARGSFIPSPALSEIADWLTKIIVGVGLIQARELGGSFMVLQMWLLRNAGLERFPLAGAIVPSVLLGGVFAGFVLGWLLTSLRISIALAITAERLEMREKALERAVAGVARGTAVVAAQTRFADQATAELGVERANLQDRVDTFLTASKAAGNAVGHLYERQPEKALAELDGLFRRQPDLQRNPLLRRWEACALGQIHAALDPASPRRKEIEDRAYGVLSQAKELGDDLEFLQLLMWPDHPQKKGLAKADREDDLESFYPLEKFRRLLELPEPRA